MPPGSLPAVLRRASRLARPSLARCLSSAAGEPSHAFSGAWSSTRRGASLAAACAATAALLAGGFAASAEAQQPVGAPPPPSPDWPVYTRAEVAKHKTRQSRIWMTYKVRRECRRLARSPPHSRPQDGVYDVTDFVAGHPGGPEKIMMAAGGAVDSFWQLYPQHLRSPSVAAALEELRIGTLSAAEAAEVASELPAGNPYASDPPLHPALRLHARTPATAEPPLELLAHDFLTPTELWYVRSHHPVPPCGREGDPERHQLQLLGAQGQPLLTLTLAELKARFPRTSVTATLQCGGNRRSEMSALRPTAGISWGAGAIGNATWTGAALTDVLAAGGLLPGVEAAQRAGVAHVVFRGADGMSASVPARKACDPAGDVLLAYEMNGQPIPAHHGAPLRAVVPGVVGVRSVKWLSAVQLSGEEAEGPWQRGMAYKPFPPSQTSLAADADTSALPSIQETPVTSAICSPSPGSAVALEDGYVTMRGYVWSGGGRGVQRVDVSADGGDSWAVATLLPLPEGVGAQPEGRAWAWRLWEATVELPKGARPGGELQLVCKAVDASQNSQPESVRSVWNLRGLNCNVMHRVNARVE